VLDVSPSSRVGTSAAAAIRCCAATARCSRIAARTLTGTRSRAPMARRGRVRLDGDETAATLPSMGDALFWAKVVKTDGCWLWTGAKTGKGYGRVKRSGCWLMATRYLLEYSSGVAIPDDIEVCHTCDNPSCVRPDHLFLGTASDNAKDALAKGRHMSQLPTFRPVHIPRKLNAEDVRTIRASAENISQISRRFGIARPTVRAIRSRKIWKHVA
jgi:hypothetical protein